MPELSRVVVVGASAAGLSAAETLRRKGFAGELVIVGAESALPYDRPPLSKQILRGTWEPDRLALRRPEALDALEATWVLGVAAGSLDVDSRSVVLTDGRTFDFDGLVIATGVRPRRLPFGHDLAGVHVLRTVDDAVALRADLRAARSLVVVGAGFLGAEVAAVARELDVAVTLVDPMKAPLSAQLGETVAQKCLSMHAQHGVDLRCGHSVRGFVSDAGSVGGAVRVVVLDDGCEIAADVVLVAIGSTPATEWLAGSGLDLGDGVCCDEYSRAAPGVVAAGDVASWRHPGHGPMRVEHRLNATEQGSAAAASLLGENSAFAPVPYFWTDQYDTKIQAYGRTHGDLDFRVVEGDLHGTRFGALYGDGERVVGALSWNMPKVAISLRAEVVAGAPWDGGPRRHER